MSEESNGREMLSEILSYLLEMAAFAQAVSVSLGKQMLLKSLISLVLHSARLNALRGFPNLSEVQS